MSESTKRWRALMVLWLILAGLGGLSPIVAEAQAGERCFPETGNCISGPIRAYWEQNGGLAIFGYPISAQHIETIEGSWTGPVQLFERDRLEDHSNEGLGVLPAGWARSSWSSRGDRGSTAASGPAPVTRSARSSPRLATTCARRSARTGGSTAAWHASATRSRP